MWMQHDGVPPHYAVQFNCCGIESANEYDTSLWRLQALGPSLAVPLTCCRLENTNHSRAYLNPIPINSNLCQALERNRHDGYRHTTFACLPDSILTCTQRPTHHNQEIKETNKNSWPDLESFTSPRLQKKSSQNGPLVRKRGAYSNETYAMTGNFRQNYNLVDRA
ncbi:hypothetical protein NQ317_014101 [Molorchus minor]|uniref:Uncharacterized protein n=1 Tax=Molorchus minor TaxID=1323400 RepID=A0ABQ9IU74_9CUCU|nr:hypothetical protein NQ317_014101 [Molorchus minor]